MTMKVGITNCENWDNNLKVEVWNEVTKDWSPFEGEVPRGGTQYHHIQGKRVLRLTLGEKGPEYGKFLGELEVEVKERGDG